MNALIKFCEPKFMITNYVYEFYNTISNLPYIIIFYFNYGKNKRTKYSYLSLCGTGIGSMLLHSTGNYLGQLIDEIFMLVFLITTLDLYKANRKSLIIYNSTLLVFYIYFRLYYIFLFLFSSQVLYLIYLCYFYTRKNTIERKFVNTGVCYFITGKLLWDLEQNYCQEFPIFSWFHSFWHILSASAAYFIIKSNEILYKRNILQ